MWRSNHSYNIMCTLLESSLFINQGTLIHQTPLRHHNLFFLIVATGTTRSALAQAAFMPAFPDSVYGPPGRPLLIQLLEWAKSPNTHSTGIWMCSEKQTFDGREAGAHGWRFLLSYSRERPWMCSQSSSRGLMGLSNHVHRNNSQPGEASLNWSSLLSFLSALISTLWISFPNKALLLYYRSWLLGNPVQDTLKWSMNNRARKYIGVSERF